MAYEFTGYFARPVLPQPDDLPPGGVWKAIASPFVGVGVRLPSLINEDALPSEAEVRGLARRFGFHEADSWVYLTYVCWGGDIDFVYGLGSRDGVPFGPFEESAHDAVEAAYTGLMERFGVSVDDAMRFDPFERGYWGDA